ncbi:MAG TPA: T9SS type A sorting domain-containing protein [Flavobacterium sp.]|nr:T9SS type A sorting domain-containing protein [Flavobacterium sp.]
MKKHYIFIIIAFLSFTCTAQIVNIPDANFKAFLLNHVPTIDINDDNEIQASEALTITQLFATSANIADLTGIEAFTNLTFLNVVDNNLTTIDVTGLVNLSGLNVDSNQLTSINLGDANNLYTLSLNDNQLTTLDLSGKTIVVVGCTNNLLTSINLTGADIQELRFQNNLMTQINLSDLANLIDFNCTNNQITSLDFSNNELLTTVYCTMNPITELDFSQNPNLFEISVFNPLLEFINLKNGANSEIYLDWLDEAPNLTYVCTDVEDVAYFANNFAAFGFPLVHVSSYCTFTPGGRYNTISGTCRFDLANDGCAATDPVIANLRVNITDADGVEGAVFTDEFGNYQFYISAGSYTIEPVSASPYFTFAPASPIINLINVFDSTTIQDFCLAPSGIHQDLEITMVPTIPARPGFDAQYILYFKNKGTETMSGTVNLEFDDNLMDFVESTPVATTQGAGTLDWAYTNLLPLEIRSIELTMNINSPTDTPAVNIGDQLDFSATVFPVTGDEMPADNVFGLKQIVVGSYDPNDITCQEGATIGIEQVGEYLHYVIRFQNSGNFYAENVVVKNIINEVDFDLSSFEIIGTSHPQVTRLTDNMVEFIFEGINLPAEADDEPGSHGYIAYKIKTNNGLVIGDSVAQAADIFFDYNFPIVTNTATTTVTALGVNQFNNFAVTIYPNPARNTITVLSNDLIRNVSLYDLQGRLLSSQKVESEEFVMDISNRSTGIYLLKIETAAGVKTERLIKD